MKDNILPEEVDIKNAPPIYLDYNATTPHAPEVIDAMRPFLEVAFGNPSSSHGYGMGPKKAVENARRQVAALIGCRPDEIIFTSGGTEANNYAIRGIALSHRSKGNHIITSQIEHPAVIEVCRYLDRLGFETTFLPVDTNGLVRVPDVKAAIRAETILITIMHANNEVGTIQPLEEISRIVKKQHIVFHTDAAQSMGKIPVKVEPLGVDLLSIAGHKIYAPKGIGALYIRKGLALEPFMHGAGQEEGKRAGTENVLGIVGLGEACRIAEDSPESHFKHMKDMRDLLYNGLKKELSRTRLNGHPEKRLPNTLSISFKNMEANRILEKIESQVAASAGAACHSDRVEISPVLKAMKVPLQWAKGTLRFSTGRMTTEAEINRAVKIIAESIHTLVENASGPRRQG